MVHVIVASASGAVTTMQTRSAQASLSIGGELAMADSNGKARYKALRRQFLQIPDNSQQGTSDIYRLPGGLGELALALALCLRLGHNQDMEFRLCTTWPHDMAASVTGGAATTSIAIATNAASYLGHQHCH
ncbi:hypothetical protein AKJ16_DCAP15151 [Drosera capensis]